MRVVVARHDSLFKCHTISRRVNTRALEWPNDIPTPCHGAMAYAVVVVVSRDKETQNARADTTIEYAMTTNCIGDRTNRTRDPSAHHDTFRAATARIVCCGGAYNVPFGCLHRMRMETPKACAAASCGRTVGFYAIVITICSIGCERLLFHDATQR